MQVWLDDERNPDDPFVRSEFNSKPNMIWVKTVPEAKKLLQTGNVDYISFDNDLGLPEEGKHLARWIEEEAYFGRIPRLDWAVHSQNIEGKKEIIAAMKNADKFWSLK
jgi:hypothetical protein